MGLHENHAGNGSPSPPTLYLSPWVWTVDYNYPIYLKSILTDKHPLFCHLLSLPQQQGALPGSFAPAGAHFSFIFSTCCLQAPKDSFYCSLPEDLQSTRPIHLGQNASVSLIGFPALAPERLLSPQECSLQLRRLGICTQTARRRSMRAVKCQVSPADTGCKWGRTASVWFF